MDQIAEQPQFTEAERIRLEEIKQEVREWASRFPGVILTEDAIKDLANQKLTTEGAILKDPLTGLANRRSFDEELPKALDTARRMKIPVSLLALDMDGLKEVNDKLGHQAGDAALQEIAHQLATNIRPMDRAFRAGDKADEFMVILLGAGGNAANGIAERIRRAIENLLITYQDNHISTTFKSTVSIGVDSFIPLINSPEDIRAIADQALLAAKAAGKNLTGFRNEKGQYATLQPDPQNPGHRIGVVRS